TVPAVVAVKPHWLPAPFFHGFFAPKQGGAELIVTFAQQIRPNFDRLACDALDRVAAGLDVRKDVLDQESRPGWGGWGHFGKVWNADPSMTGCGRRLHHFTAL